MKGFMNHEIEYKLKIRYNLQWFADGEGGEKTEPATQKKLNDARNDGKVAKSKDMCDAVGLFVLFLVVKIFISFLGENMVGVYTYVFSRLDDLVNMNEKGLETPVAAGFLSDILVKIIIMVIPFFIFGFIIAFLVSIIQVGWNVSSKPMQPKLSKFNPINGFKRILSKESLFELLKAVVKIGLIAYISYTSIVEEANNLFILYDISLNQAVAWVGNIIIDVGIKISAVFMVVGAADLLYQKHKFKEDMKMPKQEVKDEYKNTEGDPQIKGKIRRKMQEASQRRMMQVVPKADVVFTNPTHFAVALQYDAQVSTAPVVLAKGEDYLAMKIKEIARENHVEIVENKPLARMLYHNVDIGAEIPPELYQAVAEVLAAVYRIKNPNG